MGKVLEWLSNKENLLDIFLSIFLFWSLLLTNFLLWFWKESVIMESQMPWWFSFPFSLIVAMLVFVGVPVLIFFEIRLIKNRKKYLKRLQNNWER